MLWEPGLTATPRLALRDSGLAAKQKMLACAGNMAHLLNHSCTPNCVSRNHTILDPALGRAQDHVIIYALRDIAPAEELTYDYRSGLASSAACVNDSAWAGHGNNQPP